MPSPENILDTPYDSKRCRRRCHSSERSIKNGFQRQTELPLNQNQHSKRPALLHPGLAPGSHPIIMLRKTFLRLKYPDEDTCASGVSRSATQHHRYHHNQQQQQQEEEWEEEMRYASQNHKRARKRRPTHRLAPYVWETLRLAQDSQEARMDPDVMAFLGKAMNRLWAQVLEEPDTYMMSTEEFGLFNFFQHRYTDEIATAVRKRYWGGNTKVFYV